MSRLLLLLTIGIFICRANEVLAQEKLPANSDEEPIAKTFSLARAGQFLDQSSLEWTRQRKCGSCHTNYSYLIARPLLGQSDSLKEVRAFFEMRASNWDTKKPRWDTEVVATASYLAVNDAFSTGKLHPVTRAALDRMWTLQQKDGAWSWLKCGWPPFEHDDYFGALIATLGTGLAPDDYASTSKARQGLAKLRSYFKQTPTPDLHHKAFLLWASLHVDGIMSPEDQKKTVVELAAKQRADGGWCLPSLGDWKRRDDSANDPDAPSDGYATGLVLYVIQKSKQPVDRAKIRAGIAWLRNNQRASGRWFTRSLNNDRYHYITHTGTAFAVMALKAWEEKVD